MSSYDVLTDAGSHADDVVLARVAGAEGLGARWPGQVALVHADGSVDGSLLGGAFDATRVPELPSAVAAAISGPGSLVRLELSHDEAESAGLSCGGAATVLLQRISAVPESVRHELGLRRATAIVTALEDPGLSTRALMAAGDPAYDDETSPDAVARELLARGEPGDTVVETATGQVLVTVLVPTPHLVVVGGGALAAALEAQVALLGWTCSSVTDVESAVDAVDRLGPGDGVLVVDHRAEVDFPVLSRALSHGIGYVAALGSRRTQEARRTRLRDGGVDEPAIARLHGPAGLDIGSRTTAEIALSIAAEMLSVRSHR